MSYRIGYAGPNDRTSFILELVLMAKSVKAFSFLVHIDHGPTEKDSRSRGFSRLFLATATAAAQELARSVTSTPSARRPTIRNPAKELVRSRDRGDQGAAADN